MTKSMTSLRFRGVWLLPVLLAAGRGYGVEPADSCAQCHACASPTSADQCLLPCGRATPAAIAATFSRKVGPDLVILAELEDRYLPVPFDHKGHAEMAAMTSGCAACHHYTPAGAEHPACKSCHEIDPVREDIRKPGLRGAYHRQCMSCHREWSHNTKCEICHQPKAGRAAATAWDRVPTKDDIVGQMHPPISEPDTEIYQLWSAPGAPGNVIFRHKEHIHRFGLKCVECHREDSCLRCHEKGREHVQKTKSLDEHHTPCARCHNTVIPDGCDRCHWEPGTPQPAPFTHDTTGWSLNRYHKNAGCRNCHSAVPFVGRDRDCNACHAKWSPSTFDHGVTGQLLDTHHVEADCSECHVDRNFANTPTCDECHDEDEGIAFPAKRPGREGLSPKE